MCECPTSVFRAWSRDIQPHKFLASRVCCQGGVWIDFWDFPLWPKWQCTALALLGRIKFWSGQSAASAMVAWWSARLRGGCVSPRQPGFPRNTGWHLLVLFLKTSISQSQAPGFLGNIECHLVFVFSSSGFCIFVFLAGSPAFLRRWTLAAL